MVNVHIHLATLTKILGRSCGIYTLPTRRRQGQVDSLKKMITGVTPEDEL